MKKVILPILLLIILQLSCKENIIEPPPGNPPGYQEDLPWPSLSDSPWPMFYHDPQNTNRSKFSGAIKGEIEWIYEGINSQAGFATFNDVIYQLSSDMNDPFLYAISNTGELKWKLNVGFSYASPTITSNGRINIVTLNKLISVDTSGQKLWEYNLPFSATQRGLNLDKEGNFYFIAENILHCISNEGNFLWSLQNSNTNNWGSQLGFSPDGNTLYLQGLGITAIDISSRTIKWVFDCKGVNNLMIDSQGNIYFHSKTDSLKLSLFSLKPDGTIRWSYPHNDENDSPGPITIDKLGNLYFRAASNLVALDYNGKLRWQKSILPSEPIACNSNNELFITTAFDGITITKINSLGNIVWVFSTNDSSITSSVPIISADRLFIPTWDSNKIFCIK